MAAGKTVALALLLLAVTVLAGKESGSGVKGVKPTDSVAIASTPKSQQSAPPVAVAGPSSAPAPTAPAKKAPHGKREVASSYGWHQFPQQQPSQHHRYSFGGHGGHQFAELYAPATSHGSYSYSIPQHSSFPGPYGSYGTHKLFVSPSASSLKYSPGVASSHAFYSPHGGHQHQHQQLQLQPQLQQPHSFNGFTDGHVKYGSFGTKDLSDILKQLHSVGPLTIKAIPSSPYTYGSFGDHDSSSLLFDSGALHLKPMTLKLHELSGFPSSYHSSLPQPAALSAPAGPTSSSSTYGHLSHALGYEPTYANGVKGLRHYSSPNVPTSDLYSGNKYISTLSLQQPAGATMVSPLHTSVHSTLSTQKPFKPSTYLGATHETISAPSTAHAHTHPLPSGSFLAPSLQYLPPVSKVPHHAHLHKLSYDSPAKHGYLPPVPPSTNAYLPPHGKPSHAYLPPSVSGQVHSNYIPLLSASSSPSSVGSHEDTVRKPLLHHPQQHHHQQQQQQLHHQHHQFQQVDSTESLEYSAATVPIPTPTPATPHHWKH